MWLFETGQCFPGQCPHTVKVEKRKGYLTNNIIPKAFLPHTLEFCTSEQNNLKEIDFVLTALNVVFREF